jgi:murein DD-endopeptidase MepM/ murein hydrolase activator NlpD
MALTTGSRDWWGGSMRNRGVDLWQTLARFALLGLIGGIASACSESTRLAGNPFSNPFGSAQSSAEPPVTGGIADAAPVVSAPRQPVKSQPLSAPAAPTYNRPPAVASAPVAAPKAQASQSASGPAGWTTHGGTPVTLRAGDSLNSVATRYNVPASAILSANKLTSAAQVAPGRQIVIPVYNAAGGAAPAATAQGHSAEQAKLRFVQGPKPASQAGDKVGTAKDRVRQAAAHKPETKPEPKVAAKPEPKKPVQAAKAEPAKPTQVAKLEASKPAKEVAKPEPAPKAPKLEKMAVVSAPANAKPLEVVKPEPAKPAPVKEVESTASIAPSAPAAPAQPAGLAYRWPAKGRVISGFGGSGGNEGINIAVPEGTPVKAAEDGVVAYAGSEVKGYGKLVLIRHDNGYVSAYAHNGEIEVKHGEKVKRGQTIAKSGQSGNVTSPQLHFEIRKGAAPIDPMPHLQGG